MAVNAPVWDLGYAPAGVLGGPYPSYWVSLSERFMRQAAASTGKQYELDQAQTGEFNPVLSNEDALFSPVNASSFLAPNVGCYRPMRWRAQYPNTPNLLRGDQASGGDAPPYANQSVWGIGSLLGLLAGGSDYDPNASIVVGPSGAFQGSMVCQAAILASPATGHAITYFNQWSIHSGQQHTASAYCSIPVSSTGVSVHMAFRWIDASGNFISASSGSTVAIPGATSAWTRISVTATPPANAAGGDCAVVLDTSPGLGVNFCTDGWQVELAGSASTWQQPNWYALFYGGTERWPQVYDMMGTYGKSKPTIVDAFAVLSQVYPLPPFYNDVLAMSPAFFYPLDDPASVVSFRELTGNYRAAPYVTSPQGPGVLNPGQASNSGSSATGGFLGAPGPAVTFNNVDGAGGAYAIGTWIELDKIGIQGVPTTGNWTRMIAFNCPATPSNTATLWTCNQPTYQGSGSIIPAAVDLAIFGTAGASPGHLTLALYPGNTSVAPATWTSPTNLCDGNWHLIHIVCSGGGSTVTVYIDGSANVTSGPQPPLVTCIVDTIGELVLPGNNYSYQGFQGSVAHAAQWNTPLSGGQIATLYNSWRNAWSGDTSGTRYMRILNWSGYTGASSLQSGNTVSMGPATDVDGQTSALTLLENVVTTENGIHYCRGDNTIVFEQRSNRYNQVNPSVIFGEQTQNGEIPYEDVAFDFDPTHVVGQAQITQLSTNQVFLANSQTTLAPNYRPTFQRTINVTNPQEALDAANYIANRYQAAQNRVKGVRVHPSALPASWPTVLGMAISKRVRLNRRSRNNPQIQFDGFVEQMKPQIDFDTWDFVLDMELSPADLQQYWVFSALHTTSAASMTSGTNSIQLNPLPDASVNAFTCSVCSGLQLTLEPGTANAETLTVQSVANGVPLIPNGTFLTNTTGWSGSHSSTLATANTPPAQQVVNVPICVANVVATQNTQTSGLQMSAAATTGFSAGVNYRFECWVYSAIATTFTTNVNWNNSSGTFLSTTTAAVAVPANAWTKLVTTHLSPANAAQAVCYVLAGPYAIGSGFQVTGINVCVPPTVTFTANAAHNHASGVTVCEALPSGVTDPTTWDVASIVGVSTTFAY